MPVHEFTEINVYYVYVHPPMCFILTIDINKTNSNKEFNIPYDEFENDSLDYQATGLRVGVNKIIYQNIISTQVAVGIMRSTFENEVTNTLLDSSIGYTIEISMGVIFPYWDAMSIQFVTGYDLNGIKNKDNEDLLNSPFVGIGMQILGDWF